MGAFWASPPSWRTHLLLVASYTFYMWWEPAYGLLLLASTVVDYWAALRMGERDGPEERRPYMLASLAVNLGLLGTFKYLDFALQSFGPLVPGWNPPELGWLLPVGISFYTFQTLGYSIDVYRGRIGPERSFATFALFVSFWPQLVAGPIERSWSLLPQLHRTARLRYRRARDGVVRMAWGFFKKLVVADRLAMVVDPVFADPTAHPDAALVLASYAFVLQIYFDFSGYTDIAIGSARLIGIELTENFRRPLFATSVTGFWRRWHISLTTWFGDYLFADLLGPARSRAQWAASVLLTFAIIGLWHGAAWTFLVFGLIHGACLVVEQVGRRRLRRAGLLRGAGPGPLLRTARTIAVFHVLAFTTVFFRSRTLGDAWYVLTSVFTGAFTSDLGASLADATVILGFSAAASILAVEGVIGDQPIERSLRKRGAAFHLAVVSILVTATLWFGVLNEHEFIYFQF